MPLAKGECQNTAAFLTRSPESELAKKATRSLHGRAGRLLVEEFREVFGTGLNPRVYLYTAHGLLPSRPEVKVSNLVARGGSTVHRAVQMAYFSLSRGPDRFDLDDVVRVVVGRLADVDLAISVLES